jgi:hypothetical protein
MAEHNVTGCVTAADGRTGDGRMVTVAAQLARRRDLSEERATRTFYT